MRQWVAAAALVALCALPVLAQRGGRGGGYHGGGGFGASRNAPAPSPGLRVAPAPRAFSGGRPSYGPGPSFSGPRYGYAGPRYSGPRYGYAGPRPGFSGPRYAGPRYVAPRPSYFGPRYGGGVSTRSGFSVGFRTGGLHVGFRGGFHQGRYYRYRSSYLFPIPLYYNYAYSPFYDPFALSYYPSYYGSYSSYPYDSFGYANYSVAPGVTYMNQGLNDRVSNLGAEVQQLRQDNQALRDQLSEQQYAEQGPQAYAQPQSPSAHDDIPATVLVMRDGRRLEVHNYAIVGQNLWVLYDQPAMKIALSDLDVNQTTKANEERGIRFSIPAAPKP